LLPFVSTDENTAPMICLTSNFTLPALWLFVYLPNFHHKQKLVMLAGALWLLTGAALAQTKLVERVTKTGDELVIPYEKYVLPNGLTLIVHEDHSDPVVHVDVTYHVGSAREEVGKSGFAHFFEHMLFQGSDNVADEQHFKIVRKRAAPSTAAPTATAPIILKPSQATSLKKCCGWKPTAWAFSWMP
jgi:hypothetical protein